MDANIWMWLVGQLIAGAAIYGGIRADIKGIHQRIEMSEKSLVDAHARIDRMLERGH